MTESTRQRAINAQASAQLWYDVARVDVAQGWTPEAIHAQSMAQLWFDIASDIVNAAEWTQ